ncbi:MAG: hypothetical protein AAGD05_16410 [Bacteroidota bacterium]
MPVLINQRKAEATMKKVITVIGLGNVGQTLVQNLLMLNTHEWIINVLDPANVSGSIIDLAHAAAVSKRHEIMVNDFALFHTSDYIFHTAGPSFDLHASRLSVTEQSVELTYQIFENYRPQNKPYIIVIANPVDVISYHTWKASRLPADQILGTGTYLDTVRFEQSLAEVFEVPIAQIQGLIWGEHGDSQVPILSKSSINGQSLETVDAVKLDRAIAQTVKAAYSIRLTQGATKYGVSQCAVQMLLGLMDEQGIDLPASVLVNAANQQLLQCGPIYLSCPIRLSTGGVKQYSMNNLSAEEMKKMRHSASIIEKHTVKMIQQA